MPARRFTLREIILWGFFFKDDDDDDEEEYTGQTGDPFRDAVNGWDLGSDSGYDDDESSWDDTNFSDSRADEYGKKAWDLYMEFQEEEALTYINRALDLNGRHANNWNRKAIILEGMERYGESEKCYDKSLELSPQKVVYENKARMLLSWSHHLLDDAKNFPNGLDNLKEAENKIIKAINALPADSEEDISKYLKMRDSIKFYMDYENKFQRNLETLKGYDKSELFTITGRNFYKNKINFTSGMPLKLVREPDNEFDRDAIAVYAQGEKIGYVTNKDYAKFELTSSASELKDKIHDRAQAEYLFYLDRYAEIQFSIGRIIV